MNFYRKLSQIIIILLIVNLFSCSKDEKIKAPQKPNIYGLYVDSLKLTEGVVKQNETLTDLLLPHNVSYQEITDIVQLAKNKFNVRKISSGSDYKIFSKNDSTQAIQYFIYESDPINYTIIDFTDSVHNVTTGEKEVIVKERVVSGKIDNSLYQTLSSQNISDKLALKMADVFAWQVDFYRINKNDSFKVIFEEKYIGNKLIDIGRIKSAFFKHKNEKFYSFYYKQNGKDEYFDEKGNSLRKAFLKSPLKFGRMTSSYSKNRFHPVLHRFKAHLGTDYAAPTGTKIHSTGDGTVIDAKYNKNNGNYVKIRHDGTYMTQYLHMSKIADGIRPGVHVKQDQVIGYVGMTGLATGPHVCYRFWKNGEQVNSQTQKVVGSNPIPKKNLPKYKSYVDSVKAILDLTNTVSKKQNSKSKSKK